MTEIDIEARLSKADPDLGRVIKALIPRLGRLRPASSKLSPFEALVRAIIHQRMTDKAAETIYDRIRGLLSDELTPKAVSALSHRSLRSAGLSTSKARAIQNLADWFVADPRLAKSLASLSDEKIIESLTSISGIGIWTVNVLLIFNLQRLDVVPAADLGIRRGVQLALA